MGFGPSTKMTTKHHSNDPIIDVLSKYQGIEFKGVIAKGVCDKQVDKERTSKEAADMAKNMGFDAMLVSLDGWGNHHVDFTSVIGELEKNGIATAGLSFIGTQASLVTSNEYVDLIVDYNKTLAGVETQVLGENSLAEIDAMKALVKLKEKLEKRGKKLDTKKDPDESIIGSLTKEYVKIDNIEFGEGTYIKDNSLILSKDLKQIGFLEDKDTRIKDFDIRIIKKDQSDINLNTNLDIMPISTKIEGELGTGISREIDGVCLMITGVEEAYDLQPSNMGSCDGKMQDMIAFDRAGTPKSSDLMINIDLTFKEGEGRSAEGIITAHKIADKIANEIRFALKSDDIKISKKEEFHDIKRPNKLKVGLVEVVSGLGCMYDTFINPDEPNGILGGENMRDRKNSPAFFTPNQIRDGSIHSLY